MQRVGIKHIFKLPSKNFRVQSYLFLLSLFSGHDEWCVSEPERLGGRVEPEYASIIFFLLLQDIHPRWNERQTTVPVRVVGYKALGGCGCGVQHRLGSAAGEVSSEISWYLLWSVSTWGGKAGIWIGSGMETAISVQLSWQGKRMQYGWKWCDHGTENRLIGSQVGSVTSGERGPWTGMCRLCTIVCLRLSNRDPALQSPSTHLSIPGLRTDQLLQPKHQSFRSRTQETSHHHLMWLRQLTVYEINYWLTNPHEAGWLTRNAK